MQSINRSLTPILQATETVKLLKFDPNYSISEGVQWQKTDWLSGVGI
jgi:hypothetical protein